MRKVVLGAALVLAGSLSDAILLAGAMGNEWTVNGEVSAVWNLSQYGLLPAVYGFAALAVLGLGLAIWGLAERKS